MRLNVVRILCIRAANIGLLAAASSSSSEGAMELGCVHSLCKLLHQRIKVDGFMLWEVAVSLFKCQPITRANPA
jgi:hypothetical protein